VFDSFFEIVLMNSVFDSIQFNENLFFPRPDPLPGPTSCEEIYVQVDENVSVHCRKHPVPQAGISLLFFHGNGEVVSDYDDIVQAFTALGMEMTICDYRGYGKSGGTPSLRNSLEDARTIYQYLRDNGILRSLVCVMGRSLGAASAIELCSKFNDISSCIIESGYADPIPLVERRGLRIDQTTPEEDALFNNSLKVQKVHCPLLIMHGEDDFLISPKEAKMNYERAGSKMKTLEILEGVGHNDMMMAENGEYFSSIRRFLESLA
jgi:alpha-beta hydrolase superfamily lysophospholipase